MTATFIIPWPQVKRTQARIPQAVYPVRNYQVRCSKARLSSKPGTQSAFDRETYGVLPAVHAILSFQIFHEQPNDWKLQIQFPTLDDSGIYECLVSTNPPLVRRTRLTVVGEHQCLGSGCYTDIASTLATFLLKV